MLKFSGYSRLIRGRPFWCVFLGAEVRLSRVSGGASSARRSATQLASLLRAFLLAHTRATLSFLLLVATCFSLGGRLPQHLPQRRRSGRLFWFFPADRWTPRALPRRERDSLLPRLNPVRRGVLFFFLGCQISRRTVRELVLSRSDRRQCAPRGRSRRTLLSVASTA